MKNVTFVLMTCGELTEHDCLRSIALFRDDIELIEVRNVYPQIKALNLMIDSVKTEYFVPLDADMILYEDAWERIQGALKKHCVDPTWHSILFPLWDTLTDRKILALKILRSDIAKQNPFVESATPDVEHYQRLTSLGYSCIHEYLTEDPIGDHVVKGKRFCYNKYKDLYLTFRSHNFEWDSGAFMGGHDLRTKARSHFEFFLYKWVETNRNDYMHCIAGMVDGITSPVEHKSKSLDPAKKYRIKSKNAVDAFFKWYNNAQPIPESGSMLF